MSNKHQSEADARDAKRYPVTAHDDKHSVGSHTGKLPCTVDPTVASVDDESYSGSGGATGGYGLS